MTTQETALQMLRQSGAIINGHFKLHSGDCTDTFIDRHRILTFPGYFTWFCAKIAKYYRPMEIEAVIPVPNGGNEVALSTASELSRYYSARGPFQILNPIRYISVIKSTCGLFIPNPELIEGRRLLMLEDVITRGYSVMELYELLLERGAIIVGVGALFNRNNITAEVLGCSQLYAVVNQKLSSWPTNVCPMCQEGRPFTPS